VKLQMAFPVKAILKNLWLFGPIFTRFHYNIYVVFLYSLHSWFHIACIAYIGLFLHTLHVGWSVCVRHTEVLCTNS